MSHDDRSDHPNTPEQASPVPGADSPATTSGALDVPAQRSPVPVTNPDGPAARQPYEVVARPVGWPPPPRSGRFASWWARPSTVLLLLLILLALLTSTTVLAFVAITGGPGVDPTTSPAVSGSPTVTPSASATPGSGPPSTPAAPVTPSSAPSAPASPDAGVSLPIPPPDTVGVRLQGGTHETNYPGPHSGFDFDTGQDEYIGVAGDKRADVVVTEYGLVGLNGVGLALFTGSGRPQLGPCASIPRHDWVLDIPAAQFKANRTFCFTTTAGRFGYLTVQKAVHNNAGELTYAIFIYLVWEGPKD